MYRYKIVTKYFGSDVIEILTEQYVISIVCVYYL